jgi:hypothetical protein
VNAKLRARDIRVRRFWEHDLKANLDRCVEKLKRDLLAPNRQHF